MKIQHISYAELGRELHLDRSTVYWMTKQKSIDSERLYHISRILRFDFYRYAYQPLISEFTTNQSVDCQGVTCENAVSANFENVEAIIKKLSEIKSSIPIPRFSIHITLSLDE